MNFLILKTIVESTLLNYNTQNPTEKVGDNSISITGMSQKGIDLTIRTPSGRDIHVHAEVNFMNGNQVPGFTPTVQKPTDSINDQDVVEIHQALKQSNNISDLFGEV